MGYNRYRFALDLVLTLVISLFVTVLSTLFGWGFPYWVSLVIAAVIVFIGEVLFASSDGGSGGWDFD